jgi:hypothetical protein
MRLSVWLRMDRTVLIDGYHIDIEILSDVLRLRIRVCLTTP